MIDQLRLAGGVHPLPVDLPRAERGADEEAETATDQEPDEEVSASACRDSIESQSMATACISRHSDG